MCRVSVVRDIRVLNVCVRDARVPNYLLNYLLIYLLSTKCYCKLLLIIRMATMSNRIA